MGELRIDWPGKSLLEGDDALRSRLELLEVSLRIAFVRGPVADDGEALPQGVGELAVYRRGRSGGVHEKRRMLGRGFLSLRAFTPLIFP